MIKIFKIIQLKSLITCKKKKKKKKTNALKLFKMKFFILYFKSIKISEKLIDRLIKFDIYLVLAFL